MTPSNGTIPDCDAALLLPPYNTGMPESDDDSTEQDDSPVAAKSATLLRETVDEQAKLLMKTIREAHEAGLVMRVDVDHELCRVFCEYKA